MPSAPEICPVRGGASTVRPKLALIDEAWAPLPGSDPRLAYVADCRADYVRPEKVRDYPLEQFIDGLFCNRCN